MHVHVAVKQPPEVGPEETRLRRTPNGLVRDEGPRKRAEGNEPGGTQAGFIHNGSRQTQSQSGCTGGSGL